MYLNKTLGVSSQDQPTKVSQGPADGGSIWPVFCLNGPLNQRSQPAHSWAQSDAQMWLVWPADCLLNCRYFKIRSFYINNTEFWLLLKRKKIRRSGNTSHKQNQEPSEILGKSPGIEGFSINCFPSLFFTIHFQIVKTCLTSWRHLPEIKLPQAVPSVSESHTGSSCTCCSMLHLLEDHLFFWELIKCSLIL